MSEVWSAVLYIVFGFALSTGYTELRGWWNGRQQRSAVRRLVWLEIEQNLRLAGDLRHRLAATPATERYEFARLRWVALVFIRAPFPSFSHGVWLSQLAAVPRALPSDAIHLAYRHHAHLDAIRHAYDQLTYLRALGKSPFAADILSSPFHPDASDAMGTCESELDFLIALGNPVRHFLDETAAAPASRTSHAI